MKIPISYLWPFACKTRDALKEPRLIGTNIVSTNGKVCVYLPASEVEDTGGALTTVENFPNYLALFEGQDVQAPIPLPELSPCPENHECKECNGSGQCYCRHCEHSHECDVCNGSGYIIGTDSWETIVGKRKYVGVHMANLYKLPSIQFHPCNVGLFFTFGESGKGLIAGIPLPKKP